jgi:23S rRNA (adenine-N6)-dimethyltransferase
VGGDFLSFPIREEDYKIFANIPYNATACIVRKILYERPHPSEAFLVMQKEPAKKFSGRPKETLFSILAKPFFEVRVIYRLKRTDFEPVPDVDSVLLRIGRRPRPLIGTEESEVYSAFVSFGFLRWKRDLRAAYRPIFTYEQWKRLARDLGFQRDACPKQLSFEQWLGLYQWFKSSVSDEKQRALIRAFCRRS